MKKVEIRNTSEYISKADEGQEMAFDVKSASDGQRTFTEQKTSGGQETFGEQNAPGGQNASGGQRTFDEQSAPGEEGDPGEQKKDRLTDIIGRETFEAHCESQRPLRREQDINAVGIIRIDQMSTIRKEYPPEVTDQIIARVADAIKENLNEDMLLIRYWEDSFLLCYHEVSSIVKAQEFFNRLAESVRVPYGDAEVITVSIGVARCRHDPDIGYLSAYERAREALRQAQRDGGGQMIYIEEDADTVRKMEPARDIYIRTFGFFDVFVDGKAVEFPHKKAKELLALLTLHWGGHVESDEIIQTLWEGEASNISTLSRCRKVVLRLNMILEENGIDDIIVSERKRRRLDTSKVRCDFFDYLDGKVKQPPVFGGTFMAQYDWAQEHMPESGRDK